MMTKANIFVIGLPCMKDLLDEVVESIESAFEPIRKCCETKKYESQKWKCCKPSAPKKPWHSSCTSGAPLPPWGIGGKPADENLRFGAGFEIDEPRRQDYESRWEFEDDHRAFDRFVDAGEDCVARGLEKKSSAPITKCKAIRKQPWEAPPMDVDLIGETDWWGKEFEW